MHKKKQSQARAYNTFSAKEWMIICLFAVLPLANIRIPVGMFFGIAHFSMTVACSTILITPILATWLIKNKEQCKEILHETLRQNRVLLVLVIIFIGGFVLKAISGDSMESFGALYEWILLPPIAVGIVLALGCKSVVRQRRAVIVGLVIALSGACISAAITAIFFWSYDGRIQSLWPSANHLALFIAPLITWITTYFLEGYGRNVFVGSAISLAGIILLLTQSLGGVVGYVVALSIYGVWKGMRQKSKERRFTSSKKRVLLVGCIFIILCSTVVTTKIQTAYENLQRSPLASREMIWDAAGDMLRHAPLYGIELNTFQRVYLDNQKYYAPYLEWAVPLPHNILLAVWLYGGFFTLVALTGLVVYVYAISSKKCNVDLVASRIALSALLIHGAVDTPLLRADLAMIFWLIIGVSLASIVSARD